MGLFGGSKTYVSTSVSRVVDDEQIPQTTKKAMIQAVLRGDSISDSMLQENVNSPAFKFEQMYRYADSGQYYYGLPSARVVSEPEAVPLVEARLTVLNGTACQVDYLKIADVIPKHFGFQYLYDSYGYDRVSGELETLSVEKGTPVYLKKMMTVVPVDSMEDIDFTILTLERSIVPADTGWQPSYGRNSDEAEGPTNQDIYNYLKDVGRANTSKDIVYDLTPGALPHVIVTYAWETVTGVTKQTDSGEDYVITQREALEDSLTVTLPTDTFEDPKTFYQVGFTKNNGNGYGFWTYEYGTGLYTELDTFGDVQYNRQGTYFPFAVFIRDYENRALEKHSETEEFQSTKRLLNYIQVDFQNLGESLEENPDISDVIQSAMVMAVPMDTDNQIESQYLYDYFKRLKGETTNTEVARDGPYGNSVGEHNAITWSDADFSLTLSYNSITETVYGGTLVDASGEPAEYVVNTSTGSISYEVTQSGGDNVSGSETRTMEYTIYHIKKQLMTGLISEITVVNPVAKYDIDYKRSYLSTQDNSILLIPLDYLICKQYRIKEREELYHRSLHIVFNAKKTVSLKWYQTGIFKIVVIVIAAAIIYFSAGQLTDLALTIVGLVEAGLTYLAIAGVLVFLTAFAIKIYAFRLLANELGDEAAFAIAVLAVAYGGWQYFQGNVLTAEGLMVVSSNLIEGSSYVMEQDMKAITQQNVELSALKTEKEKELEKAMELLDNDYDLLDPFEFIGKKPKSIPGESPDDLYNRTVHIGNLADLSYKSIEHYVDISLRLPGID